MAFQGNTSKNGGIAGGRSITQIDFESGNDQATRRRDCNVSEGKVITFEDTFDGSPHISLPRGEDLLSQFTQ